MRAAQTQGALARCALVGRDGERSTLIGAAEDLARFSRRSLTLVEATDEGAGRTRLVEEFVSAANERALPTFCATLSAPAVCADSVSDGDAALLPEAV